MKLRYAFTMATLSSVAVGMAVHTLHAQAKPPVYMVAINEVINQEGYLKEYLPTALPSRTMVEWLSRLGPELKSMEVFRKDESSL